MGEDVGVTHGCSEKKIGRQLRYVEIQYLYTDMYIYILDETFFIIDIDHHRLLDFIDILINGRISYRAMARLIWRWFRSLFFFILDRNFRKHFHLEDSLYGIISFCFKRVETNHPVFLKRPCWSTNGFFWYC